MIEDYEDEEWIEDEDDDADDLMVCPSCHAAVHEDTQKCPNCGDWIDDAEEGVIIKDGMGSTRNAHKKCAVA